MLVDVETREAVVVDSVDQLVERDMGLIRRLGLRIRYVVETHAHADHITGAGLLRQRTGAKAATPFGCGISPADIQLAHGDKLTFGQMAGTMMACLEGMDVEREFHKALQQVASWRIQGETQELFDAGGVSIAQFESRYLK